MGLLFGTNCSMYSNNDKNSSSTSAFWAVGGRNLKKLRILPMDRCLLAINVLGMPEGKVFENSDVKPGHSYSVGKSKEFESVSEVGGSS